jgi:hypothetical protein
MEAQNTTRKTEEHLGNLGIVGRILEHILKWHGNKLN